MTTKITASNIEQSTLDVLSGGPAIANIQIANSSYGALDDTAVDTAGGFIIINGSKFSNGCSVLIGNTVATSVTFVSASVIRAQVPARSAASYVVYVSNPDGGTAISVSGLTYSNTPVWSTNSTLPSGDVDAAISVSLSASSDSNVTYSVAAGSSLPSGVNLASNGLLSGTVTGLFSDTTYNFTVVATDVENQDASRSFSITISAGDAYYNVTSLHLNGETAANSWITDSSTNKFALTVNGDTRPIAFSPYETVWSNYFDGAGTPQDHLTISNSSGLAFGTGSFTIEFWIYAPLNNNKFILGGRNAGSFIITTGGYQGTTTAGALRFVGSSELSSGTTLITDNAWHHVAIVRNGSTNVTIYVDGVSRGTGTDTTNYTQTTGSWTLGRNDLGDSDGLTGYLSNFRILKGTALYTANFTPPTSPLTSITNTSLLTCQSNRFIDNSTSNLSITRNGDVSVSNFGPFTETDLVTGSGYFDGSGDYISSPYSSSTANWYSSDTTIEMWVYPFSIVVSGTNAAPLQISHGQFNSDVLYWSFGYNASGRLGLYYFNGSAQNVTATSGTVLVNQWNHLAMTHNNSSGEIRLYLNGTLVGTGTKSGTPQSSASFPINIGVAQGTYYTGYISNVRIVNGTRVYTSDFTPPTSPLTAVTNTSLLTLQNRIGENNNRIVDASGINSLITRNGNVTQGTFSPFSQTGWSNYFDGSGDYLTVPDNAGFHFTGDFTIEAWVYRANAAYGCIASQWVANSPSDTSWIFSTNANGTIYFAYNIAGAVGVNGTTAIATLNQWNHVAVTRSGTTLRFFVNGVLDATTATASGSFLNSAGSVNIGLINTTDGGAFNGYISNLRILKGTALYTSAFTVPTSPLTAITNTSLLTCQSNRFRDNSTNNLTFTRSGDVTVEAFSPFKVTSSWSANTVGGSMYFDGTGDNLVLPTNLTSLQPGTGDYTIELFYYATAQAASGENYRTIFSYNSGTGTALRVFFQNTNGIDVWESATNKIRTSNTSTPNQWNHLAISRSGSTTRAFYNGTSIGEFAGTTDLGGTLNIGNDGASGLPFFTGFMHSFRVIKGRALYTTAFTPPTAPLSSIAGSTLLLSGTNGGIIDQTSRNNLETVGNVQLSYGITKYGNASMYFDGSGDYLVMPPGPDYAFGTGDFTIEGWVRINATGDRGIFQQGTSSFPAGTTNSVALGYNANGTWQIYAKNTNTNSSATYNTNTWYHFALVRSGTTTRLYIDGTSVITVTTDTTDYTGTHFGVGSIFGTSGTNLNGYIDDLRITKGYARYTSNFTAPTTAFLTK